MDPAGFEPIAFHIASWHLRPLDHSDRWWVGCQSLTESCHINTLNKDNVSLLWLVVYQNITCQTKSALLLPGYMLITTCILRIVHGHIKP